MTAKEFVKQKYPNAHLDKRFIPRSGNKSYFVILSDAPTEIPERLGEGIRESWAWAEAKRNIQAAKQDELP